MKINIVAYPYGENGPRTIISYLDTAEPLASLFSKDGTFTVPHAETKIENIPLNHGFAFSGVIFEEPITNEEREEVTLSLKDILMSRDGNPLPNLHPSSVMEILLAYANS